MTYISKNILPPPPTITPYSLYSIGRNLISSFGGSESVVAWPLANRAYFVPFSINQTMVITQLFASNGTTASNSIDLGIYDDNGVRLVSTGSTLQAGTSTLQVINITDTTIGAGRYYMAMAMNGTTGTNKSFSTTAVQNQAMGTFLMATAFPLPATVTFAQNTTAFVPNMGLATVVTV